MRIVPTVLAVLAVVVVALAAFVVTRPADFRIERSVRIKATPEAIYPLIADFHNWRSWSPFEEMDPAMKRDYSGAASGLGAVYTWDGNNKAGSGRMEITQARSPRLATIKLDFLKPFEAHNTAEFTMEPVGAETQVTWAMYGPNTLMGKAMSLFFNADRMIGGMFDSGLAKLKTVAEG